jgi:DNA-binding transcriptional ArsR family regulator
MKRLSEAQVTLIALRGRALGDPTRIRVLDVLARAPQPVGQIADALRCEPSIISKHLQVLFHAGLVGRRRAASSVIYSLADPALSSWSRYLAAQHVGSHDR